MLETLQHLKTDNSVKYFDYDPTSVDHFLKVLRGMMSGKFLTVLQFFGVGYE